MAAVVTGASGHVGNNLVRALLKATFDDAAWFLGPRFLLGGSRRTTSPHSLTSPRATARQTPPVFRPSSCREPPPTPQALPHSRYVSTTAQA